MSLDPGTRLGPYEIAGPLGAGGMGEVYRARDTRLGREVAIKVLPATFVDDPERRARFEREARVLATLNHPGIAIVHGLEQGASGTAGESADALIMELVEGSTLEELLRRGPLPLEQALGIAKQIAEALEAAHEHGIVHRDLKPGNVMVRADGTAKVLDFGLAKALAPDTGEPSDSPALSLAATRAGAILGTAAYMAPEQARGRRVDRGVDLWAFGCVLYEMLTGQPAFPGSDTTDIIAAVLKSEPNWARLPAETPAAVRMLLRQCLRKQPQQRLRDARAARLVLEDALAAPLSASEDQLASQGRRAGSRRLVAAAVVTAVIAVVALGASWLTSPRVPAVERPVVRVILDIQPAEGLPGSYLSIRPARTAFAISPDGSRIVFSGARGGTRQLFLRRLDESQATPIPGTTGALEPFFSPDGEWVGFWASRDNSLKKVRVDGGPVVTVAADVPVQVGTGLWGTSWGTDDTIVFARRPEYGIWRVSGAGGVPSLLTEPDPERLETGHMLPHVLPGARAMLYTVRTRRADAAASDAYSIVAQRLDTGERRTLIQGGGDAQYLRSGHLVYMNGDTLMAAPFDADRLELTGDPVAMLGDVMVALNPPALGFDDTHAAQFDVSDDGTLVYLSGGLHPPLLLELVWVDRDGSETSSDIPAAALEGARISPDGGRVASFVRRSRAEGHDIWVYDLNRRTPTRLTFTGNNMWPLWSPDGRDLVFAMDIGGVFNLARVRADGSGTPERLTVSDYSQIPAAWSGEHDVLAMLVSRGASPREIWTLAMDGASEPAPLLQTSFALSYASFSPDGRWITYSSFESGDEEVYVQAYPDLGEKIRISREGGTGPLWAPGGQELYYLNIRNRQILVVDVDTASAFRVGQPRVLFGGFSVVSHSEPLSKYDVTPDGERFLMMRLSNELEPPTPITQMHVVLNWTEELKRRVPVN